MTTGLIFDNRFLKHDTGPNHPECGERIQSVGNHLKNKTWFNELHLVPPTKADPKWISRIHDISYIKRAYAACGTGLPFLDSPDVCICEHSVEVAELAVGGALQLTTQVLDGTLDNGFALMRPPGHHAEFGQALGFCLFNNIAIVAKYAQERYGIEKVLILDWDVHHGNGTQHSFETDPSILYVSIHQYPCYPGTGAYSENGVGSGVGATLNCPMPAGSHDADYMTTFIEKILPKIDDFAPELVLLSAGFDAHRDDPLAQINLSTSMYEWMTNRLLEVADKHSSGRLISLLEGGYNLSALATCVSLHVRSLMTY